MGASIARRANSESNLLKETIITYGDFDCLNLQRFFIDPDLYLAPNAALWANVFASVPFTFPLGFDAGAIDPKVQRAAATPIVQAHVQRSRTPAWSDEVRHRPIQPNQS